MNRIKCNGCGLVNGPSEIVCPRCGKITGQRNKSPRSPREAAKKSSWLYTILFLALIGAALSYLYSGIEKSFDEVKAIELNRAPKANQAANASKTRTEQEQKQAASYKNAVQNSSGLSESQKHSDEVNKLMSPDKNKPKN